MSILALLLTKQARILHFSSSLLVLVLSLSPSHALLISYAIPTPTETGEAIGKPFRGHMDWVQSVTYTPDRRCIVSGSWDSMIQVWDAETGEPIGKPLEAHHGEVLSIAILPNGKHIVLGGGSSDIGSVDIWDFEKGDNCQPSSTILRPHIFPPLWTIDTISFDI